MNKIKLFDIDFSLSFIVICLASIGLIAVYSATHMTIQTTGGSFTKQFTLGILGLILMFTLTFIPFRFVQRSSYMFYGLSIILLIFVFDSPTNKTSSILKFNLILFSKFSIVRAFSCCL